MSFPLPLDFIGKSDLRELKQAMDQGDDRMRDSVRAIVHPVHSKSAYDDGKTMMNTLRMLAACHDHREYTTKAEDDVGYRECETVLGLRRYTFNGELLNWNLIRRDESALNFAKALVAATNVIWAVITSSTHHPMSAWVSAGLEEIWITSGPAVEFVRCHAGNIDPVLSVIDSLNPMSLDDIERILANGVLGAGTL